MTLNIADLPPALLQGLFRSLGPKDLAAVASQNAYLRAESEDSAVWELSALAKWPGANVDLYGGSWPRLFGARAIMPAAFPLAADRIYAITATAQSQAAAGGGDQGTLRTAVEDMMRCVNSVNIALAACPAVRATKEFAVVRRALAWWLAERPDMVVAFARSASETMHASFDMWTAPHGACTDAVWRRDAVAALSTLGALTAAHPSVAGRLRSEIEVLDRAVNAAVG